MLEVDNHALTQIIGFHLKQFLSEKPPKHSHLSQRWSIQLWLPKDGRHLHPIFTMKFSPSPVTKSHLSIIEDLIVLNGGPTNHIFGDSTYQKYPLFSYRIISVLFTYTRPYKISLSPDFSFIHSFIHSAIISTPNPPTQMLITQENH